MKQSGVLDIGEVVKSSGLPASTLRFYEEKGLIKPVGRHGLRRQYKTSVLQQLSLVALGRRAGFTLDEMKTMLDTGDEPKIDKRQLQAKVDELEEYIQQLKAMRDGLIHAVNCPAPSHLACPSFNRLLKLVSHKRFNHRHDSVNITISRK